MNLLEYIIGKFLSEAPKSNLRAYQKNQQQTSPEDPAEKARKAGLKHIPGSHGLWSQTGQAPATHTTRDGQFKPIQQQEPSQEPKSTQSKSEPIQTKPSEKPDEEPTTTKEPFSVDKILPLLQKDKKSVLNALTSSKESIKEQFEYRKKYGNYLRDVLKQTYGKEWFKRATVAGNNLTLIDYNGSEETKSSLEWANITVEMLTLKNVGLGTDESRAGEAATVHGLNLLIDNFKQNPNEFNLNNALGNVRSELSKVTKQPNSLLDESWLESSLDITESLINKYGIENIEFASWDTKEGNEAAGSVGHGTSADMFLKLKDGKTVGVSMKKDFNVYFMNGGLVSTMQDLIDNMTPEERDNIKSSVDLNYYFNNRDRLIKSILMDEEINNVVTGLLDSCKSGGVCPFKKGTKDFRRFVGDNTWNSAKQKVKNNKPLSTDEMKTISRISGKVGPKGKEYYNKLRNLANDTLLNVFETANKNKDFSNALKKKVVDGLHIKDTLGIGLKGIDEFVTSFGGKMLTNKNILEYFITDQSDRNILLDSIKSQNMEQIEQFFIDRIFLTYDKKANKASINFRRSNEQVDNQPRILSISEARIRERGLGSAPMFELGVSRQLEYVIRYGSDINDWPTRARNIWLKSRGKANEGFRNLIRSVLIRELEKINATN